MYTVFVASLADRLRAAIKRDRGSLYAIAKAAELDYQIVHRFASGIRDDMRTRTAERLASALGMTIELRPKKGRGTHGEETSTI